MSIIIQNKLQTAVSFVPNAATAYCYNCAEYKPLSEFYILPGGKPRSHKREKL